MNLNEKQYELIKFEDGELSINVNIDTQKDTIWLSIKQMAILFEVSTDNISLHIKNILEQNELDFGTAEEISVVQNEGSRMVRRVLKHYNLDMVLAVGYRVNSKRGILFRKWASNILKHNMIDGYSINIQRCLDCQENIIS